MHILICSDGSEQAQRALRLGTDIAVGCRAAVTLLGVAELPEQAAERLETLRREQGLLAARGLQAELLTRVGEPIAEIGRQTEAAGYDLVVIGAAHKALLGPFRMSSKSYKIIKEISPPVLSVVGNAPGSSAS
jgi:nucleotide-binding universal stress UspA family protein